VGSTIVDSPAFPAWDVSSPVRSAARVAATLRRLEGSPLVERAVGGAGHFVHMRWRPEALEQALHALLGLPPPVKERPSRALRRCNDAVRMAGLERPADLSGPLAFDEPARRLAVLLEWLGAATPLSVRIRLAREIEGRVDAWYASAALLRGDAAGLRARLLVLSAAARVLADPEGARFPTGG
jgi:hypothetical protein